MLNFRDNKTGIAEINRYTDIAQVYNLTVAEDHTYFVGVSGVLGHNIGGKCKIIDVVGFSKNISPQKQARHVYGTKEWIKKKGSYFVKESDAQEVLDAVHSGTAKILGKKKGNGDLLVQYKGVQGFNNNRRAGFVDQPTNIFFIKTGSPSSVVPTSPTAVPDILWEFK